MRDVQQKALKPGGELLWYRIKQVQTWADSSIGYLCDDANAGRVVTLLEYFPRESAQRKKDQKLYPLEACLESFNQGLERFISTAEKIARVTHPQVEKVFDVFETNHTAYAVLAYQEGEDLGALLEREQTLPEAKLMGILFPLLEGVESLFEHGVCHLGLTAAGILLQKKDGRPVLSSAHLIDQAIVGKRDALPIQTEIYRLGAILYRSVTGAWPPEEHERLEVHLRHQPDPYAPASERTEKGYSQRLLKAIDCALKLAPAERPEGIVAWRQAFEFRGSGKEWPTVDLFISPETTPKEPAEPCPETRPVPCQNGLRELAESITVHRELEQTAPEATGLGARSRTPWYKRRSKMEFIMILAVLICVGSYTLTVETMSPFSINRPAPSNKTQLPGEVENYQEVPSGVQNQPPAPRELDEAIKPGRPETNRTEPPASLPTEPPTPHQDKQLQIARLFDEARLDLKALRLTTPPKENALEKYQQILALDPNNQEAREGIRALADKYVELAFREVKLRRINRAVRYLEKALSLSPEAKNVQEMLSMVKRRLAPVF